MNPEEYQKMFDLEDHHWWFQGRYELVRRILGKQVQRVQDLNPDRPIRLLDIGCGTGMFLSRLQPEIESVGLDFSDQALEFTHTRGLKRLLCADSQVLPIADNSFDIVTAFDLIEHVERDQALVDEVFRVLKPHGSFIATVPAHPFLFGSHDVALHHHRRYRKPEFEKLFDSERWKTHRSTFAFAGIYPPAMAVRSIRKLMPKKSGAEQADTNLTPPWLNRAMIGYHHVEAMWIERINSPMGLSLMTVREKIPSQ